MNATREEGLRILSAFTGDGLKGYGKTRNFDFGPNDRRNVSCLSPYIRHRLILEEEVIASARASQSKSQTIKFVEEVFWRAYFKGWLEQHPSVWLLYRDDVARLVSNMASDTELRERYHSAINSSSGIDCFDAWARELIETGYLHNHARMWFASIWVFTLQLPWQLGADFFLRHLIDGDPASNTLSWRWVSGLHTRGKTYLARVSNIASFTDGRFSPHGQLATAAPALEESSEHATRNIQFPEVAQPRGRFGLLFTEDDLSAEGLLDDAHPQTVLGIAATRRRSPLPVGTHAYEFATAATRSAVKDTAARLSIPGQFVEADSWKKTLLDWAKQHQLEEIVVARPPVGPSQEALDEVRSALEVRRIRLIELVRNYDKETWPYADRGYFKLKKKIDPIIDRLGLDTSDVRSKLERKAPFQLDLID